MPNPTTAPLTAKDFATDQDVRWCPGCGDYSILKQVQSVLPGIGVPRERIAVISGIGCSSRFPYYVNSYGMHSIHGRAPAIVTGLKVTRPELSVWVITGDGDGLSIGGNHLIHLLRRNVNCNLLLFNNEIYGLTKGQYSPTSETGKVAKSTPLGSVDHPFNPAALALGADASFVARAMDRDPKHLQAMLRRANEHHGTSFLEIYQNCNIFNDGAFFIFTDKTTRPQHTVFVEQGQPLVFGAEREYALRLDGFKPMVFKIGEEGSLNDAWIHDEQDQIKATLLARLFDDPSEEGALPRPFGVFYAQERETYEDALNAQLAAAMNLDGPGHLPTGPGMAYAEGATQNSGGDQAAAASPAAGTAAGVEAGAAASAADAHATDTAPAFLPPELEASLDLALDEAIAGKETWTVE
jgi:2-oxoglutarate ferredoxin oxidoreductase subunit beta